MSLLTSSEIIRLMNGDVLELVTFKKTQEPTFNILALPGLGSSSRLFEWVVEFLPVDVKLCVLHPPGVGGSSAVGEESNLSELVDQIASTLFAGKSQTPWHFWGVSFGGFLAQLLSQKVRPASLSLFCTTSAQKEFPGVNAIADRAFEAAYSLGLEKRTRASAELSVHPTTRENSALFESIVHQRQEPEVQLETVLWQNREAAKFLNSDFRFDQLDPELPVLVMGGEDDRLVPVENLKCFQTLRPQTSVSVFKKADHLFFMEHPKNVAERLFHFMREQSLGECL